MNVSKLRLTEARLLPAIREAAEVSSKLVFLPALEKNSMAGMMTFLQAQRCLQKGTISGKPRFNEYGDWELTMRRYAAACVFEMQIVVICEGASVLYIGIFSEDIHVSL